MQDISQDLSPADVRDLMDDAEEGDATTETTIKAMLFEALYGAQEEGALQSDAEIRDLQEAGWLTSDQGVEIRVDGSIFLLKIQQVG